MKEEKVDKLAFVYTDAEKEQDEANAEIMAALSHPLRLRMTRELVRCGPRNVKSFVEQINVSQPAVSQHLSRLRVAGVTKQRKEGTRVIYTVDNPAIEQLIEIFYPGTLAERDELIKSGEYGEE